MGERVKRWHSQHKRIQCYVASEEYKKVEELASRMNLSVSELVKKAIMDLKGLKEEVYVKGFDDGFESGFEMGEEETLWDISRGVFNVEGYGFAYPQIPALRKADGGRHREEREQPRRLGFAEGYGGGLAPRGLRPNMTPRAST